MNNYLESIIKQFEYYRSLGDKTFEQLSEEQLLWQPNEESNSIGTIVKHMHGNMLSRWTDFLTTDGEKPWRKRDEEFEPETGGKSDIQVKWMQGWDCLLNALGSLKEEDLEKIVFIRNMGHTVIEAINRQLAHYSYHVGQIVFLGKLIAGENWQSLTIPKGQSESYNQKKFTKPKRKEHFTDDL